MSEFVPLTAQELKELVYQLNVQIERMQSKIAALEARVKTLEDN